MSPNAVSQFPGIATLNQTIINLKLSSGERCQRAAVNAENSKLKLVENMSQLSPTLRESHPPSVFSPTQQHWWKLICRQLIAIDILFGATELTFPTHTRVGIYPHQHSSQQSWWNKFPNRVDGGEKLSLGLFKVFFFFSGVALCLLSGKALWMPCFFFPEQGGLCCICFSLRKSNAFLWQPYFFEQTKKFCDRSIHVQDVKFPKKKDKTKIKLSFCPFSKLTVNGQW